MEERDPNVGLLTLAGRGLRRRCPRCGASGIFRSWGELEEWCPTCGLRFQREPGYWVGAMIINTAVTFAALLAVMVGGMLVTWPEVPWLPVFGATVAVTLATPILFYPRSKTLWLGIELSYHQLEPAEREAAANRVSQDPPTQGW